MSADAPAPVFPAWSDLSPDERAFWEVRRTVFFDIDGTLLDARGSGRAAFAAALRAATGSDDGLETMSFAGNTDARILDDLETLRGRPFSTAQRRDFWHHFARELAERLATAPAIPVNGARDFVLALRARGVGCFLLTGNFPEGAAAKLASAGLSGLFDLSAGGYGQLLADRADIARAARDSALARGFPVSPGTAVVVGDTPLDVAAARALALPAWGVAAGRHSPADLLAAGALSAWPRP